VSLIELFRGSIYRKRAPLPYRSFFLRKRQGERRNALPSTKSPTVQFVTTDFCIKIYPISDIGGGDEPGRPRACRAVSAMPVAVEKITLKHTGRRTSEYV
jgi:hypothetical protein